MGEEQEEASSTSLDGSSHKRQSIRTVATALKSNAILLWETATSTYQAYTIISSGAFEDAWFNPVSEPFNLTVNGTTVNITTRTVLEADVLALFTPVYPETALINVTVYTLAVALLLLFSLLYGLKVVRRLFTSIVLVLISLAVVAIMPGLLFIQFFISGSLLIKILTGFLFIFFTGIMGYCIYRVRDSSPSHPEMLRVEYVAIVLFFQVFDLIKDSFFLATSTDDPLFFLLTIFDMQLSWLMIVELYAEPGFDLTFTEYMKAILQSTIQAGIVILLPSGVVFIGAVYYAVYLGGRADVARDGKKTPRHDACCRCLGLNKPEVFCLSIIVDNERERAVVSALESTKDGTAEEDGVASETEPRPQREALKQRAKKVKTVSVLLWESATSFYQVYILLSTGSFEEAYYASLVFNGTQTETMVDTELWLLPKYPETSLINVAVYSLVVSSLVVVSALGVCSVVPTFQAAMTIVSLCAAVITVFPVLPYVTFLESSVVAIALFSVGSTLALAGLGYFGWKLMKNLRQYGQTVVIQYVSVIVFFQVYDMVKDVFIIVVAPEDPFVVILTVFDIVLSLLMIVEFYAEPKYALDVWEYLSCIVHYAIVATALILLPGLYVFCTFIVLALVYVYLNRKFESTTEHTNECMFYCTKTKDMKISLFSVLVSKEFERNIAP